MNCNFKSLVVLVLCLCWFFVSCGKKQTLLNTAITTESKLIIKVYEAMLEAESELEKIQKQLEKEKKKNERLEQAVRNLAGLQKKN